VLHASAGPKQKGKGCTLFFEREGNTTPFKKDAVYKF
jgi:hypothetical protein